jgi:hypothetical protein
MQYQGIGVGVVGAVGVICMVLAAGTIWLLLTDPVTVATAVSEGAISPFIEDLARLLVQALQGLFRYL